MSAQVNARRLVRAMDQLILGLKRKLAQDQARLQSLRLEEQDCLKLMGETDYATRLTSASFAKRLTRLARDADATTKAIAKQEAEILKNELRRDKVLEIEQQQISQREWNELEEMQLEHLTQALMRTSFTQDPGDSHGR